MNIGSGVNRVADDPDDEFSAAINLLFQRDGRLSESCNRMLISNFNCVSSLFGEVGASDY